MAIDTNNFSIEGVKEKVEKGEEALNRLNAASKENNLLIAIERIEQKIKTLKDIEYEVLKRFPGVSSNDDGARELVRNKIIKYNEENFGNFFGINLKNTFIDEFLKAAKATKTKDQLAQNQLAQYIVDHIVENLGEENGGLKEIDYARLFNKALATITVTEKGASITTSTRKTNIIDMSDNAPKIIVENLTSAMRKRLDTLLKNIENDEKGRFPGLENVDLSGFSQKADSIEIKFKSEWFTLTHGLSGEEIAKKIKEDPNTWEPVRARANERLVEILAAQVSGNVRSMFKNYLINEIKKNPNLFFVGKAATAITGLLGEITTILAIQELTGKTTSLEWVANNTSNGKKVSIDVVLQQHLGINVKNTSTNFSKETGFHNVDFVNRDADDVLKRLLGEEYGGALGDAFQASYFNLSYNIQRDRPHVVRGSNKVFDSVELDLLNFRDKLKSYLYQFAPEMTYMASESNEVDKQLLILDEQLTKEISGAGNALYLIGGVPFFPSQMLGDLIQDLTMLKKDLEQKSNFRNESFFFHIGGNSSKTIINVLNEWANNNQSVALGDKGGTEKVTIQMTTSWLF